MKVPVQVRQQAAHKRTNQEENKAKVMELVDMLGLGSSSF